MKNTYDVIFNDNDNSDSKGFKLTADECIDYIQLHNGSKESFFAGYKGGIVEVVCNETDEIVYTTEVR